MELFYLLFTFRVILNGRAVLGAFWCTEVCAIGALGWLVWSFWGFGFWDCLFWWTADTLHFLLFTKIPHFVNPFHLIKIKLNKSLDLRLTRFQISKIKIETSRYNRKHFFLIFLTITLQRINQPNLITDNLMIRQMIK